MGNHKPPLKYRARAKVTERFVNAPAIPKSLMCVALSQVGEPKQYAGENDGKFAPFPLLSDAHQVATKNQLLGQPYQRAQPKTHHKPPLQRYFLNEFKLDQTRCGVETEHDCDENCSEQETAN
jgi:hypothetical protein